MKNRGITLGLTPTLYGPNSPVTRLQMAAFMYRLGFQNAFLQGGNAFGTAARLGTVDPHGLELVVADKVVGRIDAVGLGANIALGTSQVVAPSISAVTIGGGDGNSVSAGGATIAGGTQNQANGDSSTVAGGGHNHAKGSHSFAAGVGARANHTGCFVWGQSLFTTGCYAAGEVVMGGHGGFYFWTAGYSDTTFTGARLAPGTGAWAAYSDRNGKQAINLVDPKAVLEKLIPMPIATWQWNAEPGNVLHMGPTAQDFRAAFGLGDSDKQIVTVDADGVALAAIQGLNAKLEAEVVALRAELAAIRSLLSQR